MYYTHLQEFYKPPAAPLLNESVLQATLGMGMGVNVTAHMRQRFTLRSFMHTKIARYTAMCHLNQHVHRWVGSTDPIPITM